MDSTKQDTRNERAKNPPCGACLRPMLRWGWYEGPSEDIEYWYCEHCDTLQVRPRRWPTLVRPARIEHFSQSDLFDALRSVRLRGYAVYPYAKATIAMRTIFPNYCYPTQAYVWRANLLNIQSLRQMVLTLCDTDILFLQGFLRLHYHDGTVRDILPPIIEEDSKTGLLLVCDGQHRLFLARQMLYQCSVVRLVSPTFREWPYYAYPLAGGWDGVSLVKDVPPSAEKKFHRFENYRDYYRDFNTAFALVGDSRLVSASESEPKPEHY